MDLATRVRQLKHRGLPAVAVAAILDLETDDVIALLDDPAAPVAAPVAAPGVSAHVFEVTDLVIPAGTDWSSDHVLGVVPPGFMGIGRRVRISLYVRLSAAFPAGETNTLYLGPFTSANDLQGLTNSLVLEPGNQEGYAENVGTLDSVYDAADWELHVATLGAVTAERSIEYARASFLAI